MGTAVPSLRRYFPMSEYEWRCVWTSVPSQNLSEYCMNNNKKNSEQVWANVGSISVACLATAKYTYQVKPAIISRVQGMSDIPLQWNEVPRGAFCHYLTFCTDKSARSFCAKSFQSQDFLKAPPLFTTRNTTTISTTLTKKKKVSRVADLTI